MKGPLVAVLVVIILLVGAGSTYLFLYLPSASTQSSDTGTSQSSSSTTTVPVPQTQSTQQTTSKVTITTAQVTASVVTCNADSKACIIKLVNTGGAAVGATACTLNGLPGVFVPPPGEIPPGGAVNVSCSPSEGGAIPIPGFHVEGFIQLSDGSSVHYTSTWA